jgi:hypothetical protein
MRRGFASTQRGAGRRYLDLATENRARAGGIFGTGLTFGKSSPFRADVLDVRRSEGEFAATVEST